MRWSWVDLPSAACILESLKRPGTFPRTSAQRAGRQRHRVRIVGCSGSQARDRSSVLTSYFSIQHVYAEVTERRLEEVILGTVFQQRTVHGVGSHLKVTECKVLFLQAWRKPTRGQTRSQETSSHLLVDVDGFGILLQLSCVGCYFQKALVCWTEMEKNR